MDNDLPKKTCKICCMEIANGARKCPYCHHFQNRWSLIMYHPAWVGLFATLPILVAAIFFANIFDSGERFETYKDQIVVTDSQIAFGDLKSGSTVTVLGTIKNNSSVAWKDVILHADFFGSEGKRTDVGEIQQYFLHLPANGTTSFKVSFRREFSETNYVKHTIQVAGAKDEKARW